MFKKNTKFLSCQCVKHNYNTSNNMPKHSLLTSHIILCDCGKQICSMCYMDHVETSPFDHPRFNLGSDSEYNKLHKLNLKN